MHEQHAAAKQQQPKHILAVSYSHDLTSLHTSGDLLDRSDRPSTSKITPLGEWIHSMSDYKSAKEAFHSDNLGASLWSINAVSLAAWTSYALYAVIARRRPVSVVLDYATTCLPLLLAVTSFAERPYLLNGLITILACIVHLFWPTTTSIRDPVGASTSKQRKSKGKWLDESDSDEEPAVPVSPSTLGPTSSATSTAIAYPSSTALDSSASSPRPSVESSTSSPTTLSPIAPDGPSQRTWKRRHSPTPSTHTHTAINILATPEAAKFPPDTPSPRSYPSRKDKSEVKESVTIAANDGAPKSPFLSVYRAHMMVMTIHCILAVDFPIFPRWQGKCEDFGTSLMDVGVGSFVFSLGIVSVRHLAGKGQTGQSVPAWLWSCVKALRKSSAVLALGVVRVLMVKGAEYPEHVTEYGVHWNFFFTLGLLPVLGTLLAPIKRIGISWSAQAILVMAIHQVALSGGLQTWVLSPIRDGLVGMNKEGLVSLPGYAAIYLLGLSTGQHVLRSSVDPHSATKTDARVGENAQEHAVSRAEKRRTELAMELFGYSVGWWTLVIGWTAFGGKVSRRMANPPYVLWTAAYNTTFLLGYLVIEMLFFPTTTPTTTPRSPAVPRLLDAINRNGLVVFLVANLLTGLVNVSMETMYLGDRAASVVLLGYSGAVCAIAWFTRGRRLKL